jgi:hypothetical protein
MKTPTVMSFEFPDDARAHARAREIADKTGRDVVVNDELGRELFRVRPSGNTRHNEVDIRAQKS